MHLPTPENLRQLEPDEIGFLILQWLKTQPRLLERNREGDRKPLTWSIIEKMYRFRDMAAPWPYEIPQLLAEGWQWLEHAGLTVPHAEQPKFRVLSRRGEMVETRQDFDEFNVLRLLPEPLIHPSIFSRVRANLLRQDFEGAVFFAFHEVEIAVRGRGGFSPEAIGTSLMRQAFGREGPLTDTTVVKAERESMEHLFAGAIGAFKNPGSHRAVPYAADEAVELVVFASRLLKIVDERAAAKDESGDED